MRCLLFGLIAGIFLRCCRAQSVDLTLVSGAIGEDVVDATILKIEALDVFPNDLDLLKRTALVETDFGTNITNPQGGIWQISPEMYSQLSEPTVQLNLFRFIARATLEFGANVTDLSSNDFSVPLRSALAARLYIQHVLGTTDVPGPIAAQATWWATHYNNRSGDAATFESLVTTYEDSQNCSISRLDIWMLIDGSGSIGSTNFGTTLQFVANLTSEFDISEDAIRVGFSVYSSSHFFVSMFNEDQNNTQLTEKVLATTYPGGGTQTGAAIDQVVTTGFNESNGLRPLSAGVPRVLVVLTDGQSADRVLSPANRARDEDISVYAVGIGRGIRRSELEQIADDNSHVFLLGDFSQLLSVLKSQLSEGACQASADIPDNTSVQVRLQPGNTYYSAVQLPTNGSVQLEFHINVTTGGSGTVYVSVTVTRPNAALHDFAIPLQLGKTVLTINSGDDDGSPVLADVLSRSRRSTGNIGSTKPLYIALQSTSTDTLDLEFQSTPSLVRAAVASTNATTASFDTTVTMTASMGPTAAEQLATANSPTLVSSTTVTTPTSMEPTTVAATSTTVSTTSSGCRVAPYSSPLLLMLFIFILLLVQ